MDILVRRDDFAAVRAALEAAGFVHGSTFGVDFFLDGPTAKPSEGVHLLFAGERVQPDYQVPSPDLTESAPGDEFRVVTLEALVRMKLVSYRLKDQVHLQDMVQVGLIDRNWPAKFPPPLDERLRAIVANPDG